MFFFSLGSFFEIGATAFASMKFASTTSECSNSTYGEFIFKVGCWISLSEGKASTEGKEETEDMDDSEDSEDISSSCSLIDDISDYEDVSTLSSFSYPKDKVSKVFTVKLTILFFLISIS